jgi:hypothetical protein
LYNLCIGGSDLFDIEWIKEAPIEDKKKVQSAFGDMNSSNLFNVVEHAIKGMRIL